MAKGRKKKGLKNVPAKASVAILRDDVEVILEEIIKHVDQGAKFKTIDSDAKEALKDDLRPRVQNKLDDKGDWAKEKAKPLLASAHVGEIAAILTVGSVIYESVLMLSYALVKNTDEVCKGTGPSGGGDWCA